jgi:transposase-like protein
MGRGRTDPHSRETKAEALALAADVGASVAAKQLGLNASTIRGWMHAAKRDLEKLGRTVVLVDDSGKALPWAQRRPLLLEAFSATAAEAMEASRESVSKHKSQDAKNFAVVAAIASEKSILLAGEATTRSESYSLTANVGDDGKTPYRAALDQKIETMLTEMQQREDVDNEQKLADLEQEAARWEQQLRELERGDDDAGAGERDPEDQAQS